MPLARDCASKARSASLNLTRTMTDARPLYRFRRQPRWQAHIHVAAAVGPAVGNPRWAYVGSFGSSLHAFTPAGLTGSRFRTAPEGM
jgi:hypothetical protein